MTPLNLRTYSVSPLGYLPSIFNALHKHYSNRKNISTASLQRSQCPGLRSHRDKGKASSMPCYSYHDRFQLDFIQRTILLSFILANLFCCSDNEPVPFFHCISPLKLNKLKFIYAFIGIFNKRAKMLSEVAMLCYQIFSNFVRLDSGAMPNQLCPQKMKLIQWRNNHTDIMSIDTLYFKNLFQQFYSTKCSVVTIH